MGAFWGPILAALLLGAIFYDVFYPMAKSLKRIADVLEGKKGEDEDKSEESQEAQD